ncbi:60 kDa SS-A/Ro ribonucleoprotein isoform X2 [Leucoraja erinacea]|uniref:60 kDa SS-A/Ro ribonucleoprotein isoform X2 n=1 Tax=Leucoraja erinaceus TaxID=7782 RepID=UPI002455091D|nr:60 kDa SS-A/Ro ribonucleoprotein isoform X2 [Leucoraja erinacea]
MDGDGGGGSCVPSASPPALTTRSIEHCFADGFKAVGVPCESEMQHVEPSTGQQVQNSEGGCMWRVTDMTRLRRFLCFGSEGGTYTTNEEKLGKENAQAILRLIEEGKGAEVIQEIKRFGIERRVATQDPTLFALALCTQCSDPSTKQAAYKALTEICCMPTHLFTYIQFRKDLSGGMKCGIWGRALRKAVATWYNSKDGMAIAMAVTRYKRKAGWSHKDLLRLSHLKPANEDLILVTKYIMKGWKEVEEAYKDKENSDGIQRLLKYFEALERVKMSRDEQEVAHLIEEYRLVREHLLTDHLKSQEVWKALLKDMPIIAILKNLGKMTAEFILKPGSEEVTMLCERLKNETALKKAQIHPFHILVALETYKTGNRGKLKWILDPEILVALNQAFYKAFKNIEPTGKHFVLALDVSSSMCSHILGCRALCAYSVAAVMSMVVKQTEANSTIVAFSDGMVPLHITSEMALDKVLAAMHVVPFGSMDCALPMLWAVKTKTAADVFIVLTGNDTYYGNIHPAEALREYRKKMAIPAKLVICGLGSNGFSIADPDDRGMMDICGFDNGALEVIRNFALDLI